MSKLLCLVLVILVAAEFSLADRRFRCRRSSGSRIGTAACLWKTDPDISEVDPNRNVYCNDTDIQGGVVSTFTFPDNNKPMCLTLVYYLAVELDVLHIKIWGLIRGGWGGVNSHVDEQKMQSCLDICKYFRDGGSVSISVVRAKPNYMGCYLRENGNSENMERVNMPNVIDCAAYGEQVDATTPAPGMSAGWVLVIIIVVGIVVIIAIAAGLFYFLKVRGGSLPFNVPFVGGNNAPKTDQPVSFVPSVALDAGKEGGNV